MKRNRMSKVIAFALAMFMVFGLVKAGSVDANAADKPVAIVQATFPDDIFREYVKTHYDKDRDGKLSQTEISNVTEINCSGYEVSDLSGIELFSDIINLDCSYTKLTSLDVSNFSKLTKLNCKESGLTSLDVSGCSALRSLYCNDNQLTSLDVSGCSELIDFDCGANELTSLDVSGCSKLYKLNCRWNQLTSLDVSGCSALRDLDCNDNQLTSLDVSSCSNLLYLYCRINQLSELDVSACSELSILYCDDNQLSELDVSACSSLRNLVCGENRLTSLDVSSCDELTLCSTAFNKATVQLSDARQFDLSTLPKFDVSKVKSITGGTIKGNILSVDKGVSEVTYDYDISRGWTVTFMFQVIEPLAPVTVSYRTHVQSYGWQEFVKNGVMSGTQGEAKRLEGIEIKISGNKNVGIRYKTHVQTYGWEQDWKKNGTMSGTQGESKRLEAICIELTGADKDKYDVYYRVHAQSYGWLGWAKNGQPAGTAGQAKRLEGIEIKVLPKGEKPEGMVGYSYIELGKAAKNNQSAGMVNYMTHVQSYGDQSYVFDGSVSGTFGEAKRLEGIRINLNNDLTGVSGGITYRTHVQSYGWLDWSKNGNFNGTQGEAKRLEAIEIKLTGEMANQYDVYYRVHAQSYGWLGWAKNGESAGTAKLAKRLEGIQIVVLPKGSPAPGILPGVAGTPAFITQ